MNISVLGEKADLLAFEHEGHVIRNPYLSPNGDAKADPQADYGFELHHSGGGHMALVKRFSNGEEIWLTDEDANLPDPAFPDEILIGRYNADGETLACANLKDVTGENSAIDFSASSPQP